VGNIIEERHLRRVEKFMSETEIEVSEVGDGAEFP
jgi:hypothetical protein